MRNKIVAFAIAMLPIVAFSQEWKTVPAQDFQGYVNSGRGQVVDVRTSREFAGGHIEGAVNVDYYGDNFRQEILKLDKTKPVYVYCYGGGRSTDAAQVLTANGYQVVEL
jgi:rhodanese-related sulfurtransferase